MKKLLLVEVPDDLKLHIIGIDTKVPANHFPLQFKEIQIPTEGEINDNFSYLPNNNLFNTRQLDRQEGAKWAINKIMEEK